MINLKSTAIITAILAISASAALAGAPAPLPAAGLGGPVALIAAVGAVGVYNYVRRRQK
jgi:hypothetical protein